MPDKPVGLDNMTPDMTKDQKDAIERAEDAKIERHFKSQRELPSGRNFRWNMSLDKKGEKLYRDNFDNIFPNSPGAGI